MGYLHILLINGRSNETTMGAAQRFCTLFTTTYTQTDLELRGMFQHVVIQGIDHSPNRFHIFCQVHYLS
jgi:hypothetical protein